MNLRLDESTATPAEDGQPLVDMLFERLSEAIVTGELAPGSKLSEPRLAVRHGVSRAPLREAIRRLEERKLVVRTPRQGVRVVIPSLATAVELFKIREVLEGLAAREAARLAQPDEVRRLREMLAGHRLALEQPDAMVYWQATANSDFHFTIARMARSGHLFDLLCNEYYTLFRLYRMQHRMLPGRAQRALLEHERVVDAIAEGDGELAELLMRRHVAAARLGLETATAVPGEAARL
ncbi:MAG TPA: GntR family transcriptional regulator [Devosiaceae bacterium]|jgi:DNA-binding GntR family transcriptional regulator|nr:GntR family transcriptional regulator [Devosiaceae bacterium]